MTPLDRRQALGGLVGLAMLGPCAGTGLAAEPTPAAGPAALPLTLQRPAAHGPKALQAGMLAITRVGRRLVAVGERGIVLWSDDAGQQWQQAQVPVQVTLTQVRFVDERIGWAVGHLGVVLRSTDGDEHWTRVLDGLQAARVLAAADPAAQSLLADGPDKPFFDMLALDAQRVLVVGAYGLMLASDDAGATWQAAPQRLDSQRSLHLYAAQRLGDAMYLAGEQGWLLRSRDDGQHFETLATPYKGSFFGLVGTAAGSLIAHGLRGQAWHSADQGNTWQRAATGVTSGLSAGLARADGSVLLLSQNGELLLSEDDGRRFKVRSVVPMPAAGVAEAGPGALMLAGLRGLRRVSLP
jgi:photosystem II stability/assembly factor-like uncharacterized protein